MPVPNFTDHVDGDTITATSFDANMTLARDWLNDLVSSDFASGSIRSENFVRPIIAGFPTNGFESSFQGLWWFSYGNLESPNWGVEREPWGAFPKRLKIIPNLVQAGDRWALPIGKTIYLPTNMDVEVNVSFDFMVRSPTTSVSCQYPSGAGAGEKCGRFMVSRRDRLTGAVTDDANAEAYVYHSQQTFSSSTNRPQTVQLTWSDELLGNRHWDIFISYKRLTSDSLLIWSIDVSRVLGKIEAF